MSITPLMPVYPRCGVRPVRGEHCHLIDEDGTRYLDFASEERFDLIALLAWGRRVQHADGLIKRILSGLLPVFEVFEFFGHAQSFPRRRSHSLQLISL